MTVLRRVPGVLGLLLWSVWAISRASVQVARDVVSPRPRLAPAIIVVNLNAQSRLEVAMLTSLIALMPGTLPVGLPDERTLWVHGMYGADSDDLHREIEEVETRVLRALRGNQSTVATR